MDNWAHRSEGMRCKTCMWFVPKLMQKKWEIKKNAADAEGGVPQWQVFLLYFTLTGAEITN